MKKRQFHATITYTFEVGEGVSLGAAFSEYSAKDWEENTKEILRDAGINKHLPTPTNISVEITEEQ